jgi:hypothetical protein
MKSESKSHIDYFLVRVRDSEILYDWRFTANQSVLASSPLRLTARIFFSSQLNTCSHSPYITYSLTRKWVCHLQLLLALAREFILGYESRGTRDQILLSQIRDFPFRRLLRLAELPHTAYPIQGFSFSYSFVYARVVPETCMNRCLAKQLVPCLAPLFRLLGGIYWAVA